MHQIIIPLALLIFLPTIGSTIAAENPVAPSTAPATTAKLKTIQMRIAGMTCAACARGLEASLRKMTGVDKVAVDYKAGQAVITFDPGKQSVDSISKFVAD